MDLFCINTRPAIFEGISLYSPTAKVCLRTSQTDPQSVHIIVGEGAVSVRAGNMFHYHPTENRVTEPASPLLLPENTKSSSWHPLRQCHFLKWQPASQNGHLVWVFMNEFA